MTRSRYCKPTSDDATSPGRLAGPLVSNETYEAGPDSLLLGFAAEDSYSPGVERLRGRLVFRPGEDIYLVAEPDVYEAGVVQYPPPLCLQQSAGDSAGP